MGIREALKNLHSKALFLDRLPFSASSLGDAWMDALHARHEKEAMRDPVYAYEEKRRRLPDGGFIVSSEKEGLSLDGWFEHEKLRRSLYTESFEDKAASALRSLKLAAGTSVLIDAYDNLTRGWTDSDVWNLDFSLSKRTGEQLLELSKTAHGWPDQVYDTYEEWCFALFDNGTKLLEYARADGVDELTETWSALPSGKEKDRARDAIDAREEELRKNASSAWEWVSRNHYHLWD